MYRKLAEVSIEHAEEDSVNGLIRIYKKEILPGKAKTSIKTQDKYLDDWGAILGHMHPISVKPHHIAKAHDAFGQVARVSANRRLEVIRHVFSIGIRKGYAGLESNPASKVSRHKETPRTRLPSLEEYITVYLAAPPAVQVAMELARITGMRQGDILKLRWSEVSQDGLFNQANKNKRRIIFRMNRSLKATLDQAKTILKDSISHYVVPSRKGGRYTSSGFQSSWQRLIRSVKLDERFTYHDIRAMASTERQSDKSAAELLGNTEAATRKHYRRGIPVVEPNE
jgi:integrase